MLTDEPSRFSRLWSFLDNIYSALVWIAVVALLSLGVWASYYAIVRTDQYQLIHLGQVIWDGGRMYVDCWENKSPGIAWLNALGLFCAGGSELGAWILPGVVALSAVVVYPASATGWPVPRPPASAAYVSTTRASPKASMT